MAPSTASQTALETHCAAKHFKAMSGYFKEAHLITFHARVLSIVLPGDGSKSPGDNQIQTLCQKAIVAKELREKAN